MLFRSSRFTPSFQHPLMMDPGDTAAVFGFQKNCGDPSTGRFQRRQGIRVSDCRQAMGYSWPRGADLEPFGWQAPISHAALLMAALAIDRWVGEPPVRIHPVVWMGSLIGWARDRAPSGRARRFVWGVGMATLLPAAASLLGT